MLEAEDNEDIKEYSLEWQSLGDKAVDVLAITLCVKIHNKTHH